MNKNNKFSIGEFSEKTGIAIRTLHYYDEIGLLQPEKHPSSGHRVYKYQDILTLQKILSLKFLGYSLKKINDLLHESSITVELNETLSLHLHALEEKKQQIEKSISAIKRVSSILEEEKEVDSNLLFSLILMENSQIEWLEEHSLTGVAEGLSSKSEDEKKSLDKMFIQMSKKLKHLYGKPVEDPEVQEMVKEYLDATFSFLGDEMIEKLANAEVDEKQIQEFEALAPSPFTQEEQNWLNEAMEYFVKQAEVKE